MLLTFIPPPCCGSGALSSGWYHKPLPTFSDAFTATRAHVWTAIFVDTSENTKLLVADAQRMGEEVRQAEAFWNQKAAEMKARHKRGESPFTVEILQALGLQNTGNRLYTLLCAAGQDLRQNQDYWSLSNYLGIWYSRNLVEIYETGNLSAIHNEGIGGGGAGSLAELAKAIETAGNQKRPKFGP